MEKTKRGMQKHSLVYISLIIALIASLYVQSTKHMETKEELVQTIETVKKLEIENANKEDLIEKKINQVNKINNDILILKKQSTNMKNELEKSNSQIKSLQDQLKKEKATKQSSSGWTNFTMTYYTAKCKGCTGKTATGVDVRNTTMNNGYRVISVDPSIIPLGSIVEINEGGNVYKAQALDTGSAIKGRKVDMLVATTATANKNGVKTVKIRVVRKGW